jgi:hypothetical protein
MRELKTPLSASLKDTLSEVQPASVEPHILHQLVTMKQSSAIHVYDSFEPLSET